MTELVAAFLESYRPHIEAKCLSLGVEPPGEAINEGRSWLEAELTSLVATPFAKQRRGPLELFQEAMRFPTAALHEAGVEPIGRDEVAEVALPGDLYGLAPASSQELSEAAWHAHLQWGVAKARALTTEP